MKFFLFVSLFLATGILFSQEFQIEGKVTDKKGVPLGSATVYVEKPADSSLVTYTISQPGGEFSLQGRSNGQKLNFYISYAGFKPYKTQLKNEDKNLGTIVMEVLDNQLGEVTVTAARAPVSIKSDTLEFNAASFKTRENANLEDVLKELPGVSVDNDGNITVNGKPVSRILVNGKEFFGDDPKIATKNLPKEIINKIQVVDTKTKSEEFTGKEGDSENKTINITIDEDKNRGYFTRLTAGAGTDDRYELSGISNYFKDKLRVSILASSNNINSSGFTFDEVFDAMGRNAYSIARNSNGAFSINGNSYGNMGGGITASDNLGFSFVNEWPQKTELGVNYFYNHANTRNETKIERENILPDRHYFVNSISNSNRINDNHRFSTSFEIQPDTLTRISFRPNFNVTNANSFSDSYTESVQPDGTLINTALTKTRSDVFSSNFSNRLYFSRKFGKNEGGSYSVGFNNDNVNLVQKDYFFSERNIYDQGELSGSEIQDQFIDIDRKRNNYGLFLSTRLPLSKVFDLDMQVEYDDENVKNERFVYNNSGPGDYEDLNELLSTNFKTDMSTFKPSAGLVFNNDTLRVSFMAGLLHTQLKNEELITNVGINKTYDNFYTRGYVQYKLTKSKSLYANFSNQRELPDVDRLLPIAITTNPLNIIKGNPNLAPSLTTRVYLNFNNYDFASRSGYYIYASGQFANDDIVPITFTDENLVRTTTYTNVDGAQRFYGGVNLNRKYELDSLNSIKFEPGLYGNYAKNLGFSNGERYSAKTLGFNPHVSVQYDWKEVLTLEPYYRMGLVHANYSLNNREENYINHELNFQVTSYWPKNFIIGSDLSFQKFGNIPPGFKNSFLLWNASLGYKLLGDDGIFKVKMFDILDENTSTSRFTGEDFIQNTQELVLERYLMFSFTWKFSKFGGKDPNENKSGFF